MIFSTLPPPPPGVDSLIFRAASFAPIPEFRRGLESDKKTHQKKKTKLERSKKTQEKIFIEKYFSSKFLQNSGNFPKISKIFGFSKISKMMKNINFHQQNFQLFCQELARHFLPHPRKYIEHVSFVRILTRSLDCD